MNERLRQFAITLVSSERSLSYWMPPWCDAKYADIKRSKTIRSLSLSPGPSSDMKTTVPPQRSGEIDWYSLLRQSPTRRHHFHRNIKYNNLCTLSNQRLAGSGCKGARKFASFVASKNVGAESIKNRSLRSATKRLDCYPRDAPIFWRFMKKHHIASTFLIIFGMVLAPPLTKRISVGVDPFFCTSLAWIRSVHGNGESRIKAISSSAMGAPLRH